MTRISPIEFKEKCENKHIIHIFPLMEHRLLAEDFTLSAIKDFTQEKTPSKTVESGSFKAPAPVKM